MKPFYKSKTFWFNVYCVAAYALKHFGVIELPMPDLSVAAAANLALRAVTTTGLSVGKGS